MLVVHPHLHSRRTGVTRHVEALVHALGSRLELKGLGPALDGSVPRIRLAEVLNRARTEPVVWHAHRNLELLLGLLVRWLRPRTAIVYTRHSATPPSLYTRWLSRAANVRVALTSSGTRELAAPVQVIGHGVDTARFKPGRRDAAWRALGLPGTYGVGVIGRIRPEKGQGDFLSALAPVLSRFPEWTPVLVGQVKKQDAPWLKREAAPVRERLVLAGEVKDTVPWFQGLTVVVQPSRSEGFGLVLLEALAAGCCVIAAQLPHYEGILEDGHTGMFYPPGDVAALKRCLEFAFQNPDRAARMGGAARERVLEKFGIEHEADALAAVYRSLA